MYSTQRKQYYWFTWTIVSSCRRKVQAADNLICDLQEGNEKFEFTDDGHLEKYLGVVGMLNYLAGTTRPDIAMAVHQAVRFCINPKL